MQILLILKKFNMKLNIKWLYTIMRPPNIDLKVKVLIWVWIIKRTPKKKKKKNCNVTSTIAGSSRSLISRTLRVFFIIMVVSILLHCIFALLMPYAS